MALIVRQTLSDATADALRDRIVQGALRAGDPLRQEALAAELGVSRIPLREALRRLEAEGLVSLLPHRGAVVAELPVADIVELFELRAMLESDLILRSVPALTTSDHANCRALAGEFAAALETSDIARLGEANLRFHSALYSRADRPRTLEVVTRLHAQCDRLLRLQLTLTRGGPRAIREHLAIASAARSGNAERAASLTNDHILGAGRRLANALATHQKNGIQS